MSKKTSYINGAALVVFGGGVCVHDGFTKDNRAVVAFSELKEQKECGADIDENEPHYDIQVQLFFNDLKSIDICRQALDHAERFLKDKEQQ